MIVLAIDPGLANTGYAVGAYPNKILECGKITTTPADGTDFQRTLKLKSHIKQVIQTYKPSLMLIEKYRVYGDPITRQGKKHGEKTIRIIQSLEELAHEHGIEVKEVDYNSWKASFSKVWTVVELSSKFPHLEELYTQLQQKAYYTKKGAKRKGNKDDHELDAFKMLLPHIISYKEAIINGRK